MKWYWALKWANTVTNPLVATDADLMGIDEWALRAGTTVENWNDRAWFMSTNEEDDGTPDDVLQECLDVPVYSERLRKALKDAGVSGIQYLPVRVLRSDRTEIAGYAIANVLARVSVLDLKESTFEVFGDDRPDRAGELRDLRKAVLKRALLVGHDIVRLREYEMPLFVSGRFRRAFRQLGFTGYDFKEVALT